MATGQVTDIEELGISVIVCPWHRFMVDIADGTRAYQAVDMVDGKTIVKGWVKGKTVQRCHEVYESSEGVFVSLNESSDRISSDGDARNPSCVKGYHMHSEVPTIAHK